MEQDIIQDLLISGFMVTLIQAYNSYRSLKSNYANFWGRHVVDVGSELPDEQAEQRLSVTKYIKV